MIESARALIVRRRTEPTDQVGLPPALAARSTGALRLQVPSPLQPIEAPVLDAAGVRLLLKRDDLIHDELGGNKWRKLKYNLLDAHRAGADTLLTFGGAHSNHLYATAAAGKHFGFETIGVVRGELRDTPTLRYAMSCGMRLVAMDRGAYRRKHSPETIAHLRRRFGRFHLIPEGGSNAAALRGCIELARELDGAADLVCCACGTGGTLAGLIAGLGPGTSVLGFAALKGASFLERDVRALLADGGHEDPGGWRIDLDHHFGGFARTTPALLAFMADFTDRHGIPLDHVYTGKMLSGLHDLVRRGELRACTVVAVHTGGLQPAAYHRPSA